MRVSRRIFRGAVTFGGVDVSVGVTERLPNALPVLDKCEFPHSPFDNVIQEIDSQEDIRVVPKYVRKIMAMSRRKKTEFKEGKYSSESSTTAIGNTSYLSFTLCKAGSSTKAAIMKISDRSGIPQEDFILTNKTGPFALTSQRVSVRSTHLARLRELELNQDFTEGVGVTEIKDFPENISPHSMHVGNSFRFRYRHADQYREETARQAVENIKENGVINYYTAERFPMNSHLIGAAIEQGNYGEGIKVLVDWFRSTSPIEEVKEAAEEYIFSGDSDAAIGILHRAGVHTKSGLLQLMELLNESTGNNAFEGALRSFMEGRLWEISVNQASPSWRWNMAASKRIGKSVEIEVGDVVLDEGRLRKVTPCMVGRFSLSSLMLPRETPIGKEIELGTLQGTDEIDERFVNEVWTDGLVEDEAEFFLATDARFRGKIRYRRLVAKPWDVNLTYELLPTRDVTPPKRNALLEFKLPAGSSGSIVHKALTGEGMKRL